MSKKKPRPVALKRALEERLIRKIVKKGESAEKDAPGPRAREAP